MGRLEGRTAIVTGAAGGIGLATAEKFLEEGAAVMICDVEEDRLKAAAEALSAKGKVLWQKADISDPEEAAALVRRTAEELGGPDILINNAGITRDAQLYKMELEQFEKVIRVNLIGTVVMCKAVIPHMMEHQYGRIVNCSSVSALAGNFGQTNYASSKGAIWSLTRSMGHELGKYGITVNAVIPGAIETPMTQAIPDDIRAKKAATFPMRRWGSAREVANVYCFLASEEASYVNATSLVVDGGYL
mgnify:CR=1 FL=1